MKREVTFALMKNNQSLFVPGYGSLPPTLTKEKSGQHKGYEMWVEGSVMYVNLGKQTLAVPTSTLSHFMIGAE